eukprot:scaffold5169_cov172-Amphora_coffeaeformis.AAC.18
MAVDVDKRVDPLPEIHTARQDDDGAWLGEPAAIGCESSSMPFSDLVRGEQQYRTSSEQQR